MNRSARFLVLLVSLALLLTAAVGTAAKPPVLRVGAHGQRVGDAQWLLRGHNVFHIGTYKGPIDRKYQAGTARSTKHMKYRLGYSPKAINGRFGRVLFTFLTGKRHLPPPYEARKHRRWLAKLREQDQARLGVVALVGGCRDAPPNAYVLVYARRVAAVYGRPLVCTSGRRHTNVQGTHRPSMHNFGQAADLATPTEAMNLAVGRAALIAAGMPPTKARLIFTPCGRPDLGFCWWYGGVNILFQTLEGGNHHNHVHVGLRCWPHAAACRFPMGPR